MLCSRTISDAKVNHLKSDTLISMKIENIFTAKDLEKDPTKTLSGYKAPSILDPKNVLSEAEEQELMGLMQRIGTDVKHRRLLIKPFF